jgi:hypothetical protein
MVTPEERLTEMEQRVADLEAELRARHRPRFELGNLLHEIMPAEVRTHMRAAQRERLLAARAYLDRVIARLGSSADDTGVDV